MEPDQALQVSERSLAVEWAGHDDAGSVCPGLNVDGNGHRECWRNQRSEVGQQR
jgi:hypothetical protein